MYPVKQKRDGKAEVYVCILQVEPGNPGAEVSRGKNYKPKKELACLGLRVCNASDEWRR